MLIREELLTEFGGKGFEELRLCYQEWVLYFLDRVNVINNSSGTSSTGTSATSLNLFGFLMSVGAARSKFVRDLESVMES